MSERTAGPSRTSVPTASEIERLCSDLRGRAAALRSRPVDQICDVLGRTGARFLTDGDPVRTRALEELPEAARLSPGMARVVLDGMARDWTADRLRTLVAAELADPACLDGIVAADRAAALPPANGPAASPSPAQPGASRPHAGPPSRRERGLMAVGPALCVQIVSGSVPGVGVQALLRSLLVKAPTLLKPGHGDALLPELFAEALREEDPDLADALIVAYWPGGSTQLDKAALAAAEVAVVYGSDQTVATLRALAPATTRVVAYHHRVGVGVVGREALAAGGREGLDVGAADRVGGEPREGDGAPASGDGPATRAAASGDRPATRTAADLARAVVLFEQRGCVCPQVVYVEEGGEVAPAGFARLLAEALARLDSELPPPRASLDEAGPRSQLRGTAEILAATGAVELHHGGEEGAWTLILEHEEVELPPGGARTVRVRPIDDAGRLAGALEAIGPHLQSVGYAGLGDRVYRVAEALGRAGASRVADFGDLSFPPPWWLHDGRGPLRDLVRWVELERNGGG